MGSIPQLYGSVFCLYFGLFCEVACGKQNSLVSLEIMHRSQNTSYIQVSYKIMRRPFLDLNSYCSAILLCNYINSIITAFFPIR